MNEHQIIDNLRKIIKDPKALNLNDDVVFDKKKSLVVSIDTYNEGVHFVNFKNPNLIIMKAIRSSISDIISKGVDPKYMLITFSGSKKHFKKENIKLMLNTIKKEQKKYNFLLVGGDTTQSIKTSFTICVFSYSKKIIKRNTCYNNDDIYITGNIGDSSIGLNILKNKIKCSSKLKKYFVEKYFKPNLAYGFHRELFKFATSSMDISDGLLIDLKKLIGNKKLNFVINYNLLPKSNNFKILSKQKRLSSKKHLFAGDDYQILFTAKNRLRNVILKSSIKWNQKVTRIGTIVNTGYNSLIFDNKLKKIIDYQGYIHNFG